MGETFGMQRELAQRENDGLCVSLLWQPQTNGLSVWVRDWRTGEDFELDVGSCDPMDVFEHPYAYAPRHERQLAAAATEAVYA